MLIQDMLTLMLFVFFTRHVNSHAVCFFTRHVNSHTVLIQESCAAVPRHMREMRYEIKVL